MKVFVIIVTIFSSSVVSQLISFGEIETHFNKLLKNEITGPELETLQDVFEILYKHDFRGRNSQFRLESRDSLDCLLCRSIFGAFFQNVRNGVPDEEIMEGLIVLCSTLNIVSPPVCRGTILLNVPILIHIIKTTPEAQPLTFCGLVLQRVGDPSFCPYNDSRFDWEVTLPERAEIENNPDSDTRPLKVVLVSDAHIDPLYEPGGVADCGEPTCCRKGQTPARSFSYISNVDISLIERSVLNVNGEKMLNLNVAKTLRSMEQLRQSRSDSSEPAGYWGDYRDCDTPIWAYDDAIDIISSSHRDVDVIYYMGDSIDHHVWETTYELINEVNAQIVDKMKNSFGDHVQVYPVIGNHESQPTNQFAPESIIGEKLNTTWLYAALANKWSDYLTDEAKETLLKRGEYSMLVRPGLRVISLNNNVAYKYNWWLVYDPLDAKRHLDWLIEELYKAEQAGEKVHILGHISPGVSDFTHTWTREYNRIINRFASTIAAEFNGHTHSDEFKIFYDSDDNPITVAWGAGSVTAYANYNLNYKIATFNVSTYEPENIVNYVYNLTEANLTPNRRPHWFQLYDIKNSFGLTDLSPQSMNDLVYHMVTDKRMFLDLYSAFFSKLSDTRWPYCNDSCKLGYICRAVVTVLWEREKCDELVRLFYS